MPGFALSEGDKDEKWDAYLVESILHPEAKIVEGFQNVMPSQESAFSDSPGSPPVLADIKARIAANKETSNKEKKLIAITEFIKSNGNNYKAMKTPEAAPPAAGEAAKPQAATGQAATGTETPAEKPAERAPATKDSASKEDKK